MSSAAVVTGAFKANQIVTQISDFVLDGRIYFHVFFPTMFKKGDNFFAFLFASLAEEALPK